MNFQDIPTAVTQEEQEKLAELAAGRTVLELGSDYGASTVMLAQVASVVYAVDAWQMRPEEDVFALFIANLERCGVTERVVVYRGWFADVVPQLKRDFDLAFLDGNHSYKETVEQAHLAGSVLKPSSVLAFHDYTASFPGVMRAVDEIGQAQVVGELAWLTV
jgi:predicted O-methyltransferase YrrM